jgi:TolA-binding protein
MWCERCGYYTEEPNPAVCEHCGRYIHNKLAEAAVIAAVAVALALFSHYILTGRLAGGPRLFWVGSGLADPYGIYDSPEYSEVAALTLAALVAIPVLSGFHYGPVIGAIIGLLTGLFSGVYLGGLVFAGASALGALKRTRHFPVIVWPVLSALAGGGYYLLLAWLDGPSDPLYRRALVEFLVKAAILAALAVAFVVLLEARIRYRSWPFIPVAVFLAGAPVAVFLAAIGPADFEAVRIMKIFDPSKILSFELQQGFVTGQAPSRRLDLAGGKQLGHVLETAEYVNQVGAWAAAACDDHLRRFPSSRDAADLLLFKATVYNGRLDLGMLTRLGRLEVYFDRVSADSVPVYEEVIKRFPAARQAGIARYGIAQEAFQAGRIMDAQRLYAQAEAALASSPADYSGEDAPAPKTVAELYSNGRARWMKLEKELYNALVGTRRAESLIANNMDYAGQPLQRLAMLDPRNEGFEAQARDIVAAYPASRLVDNVKLTLAERISGPAERAAAIAALLDEYPDSDVADEMLYQRARALYLANLTGRGPAEAAPLLRRLLADYPTSTCAPDAARLLAKVSSARSPAVAP